MEMDARFDAIDARLDRLETGQAELKAGQAELKAGHAQLKAELKHEMRVLHEDAISRIADAMPVYDGPTRAEFLDLKEMIGRRLDPLETAVRHHSVEIERLKRRRR